MSFGAIGYSGIMVALLVCHFLGDFTPLSTPRMLEAKRTASPPWIVVHALVHAALVGMVVAALAGPSTPMLVAVFTIVWGTHFGIDLVRARLGVRWSRLADPKARAFWVLLGADQLAHGVVLVVIAALVTGGQVTGG